MGWMAVAVVAVSPPLLVGRDHLPAVAAVASLSSGSLACDPRQFYGVLGLGDGGYKMGLASTPIGTTVNISYMTAWLRANLSWEKRKRS